MVTPRRGHVTLADDEREMDDVDEVLANARCPRALKLFSTWSPFRWH